jgi:hypothetical protein
VEIATYSSNSKPLGSLSVSISALRLRMYAVDLPASPIPSTIVIVRGT